MSDIKISQMEPWVGALTGNEEFPIVTANAQSTNYRVALSQITPSTLGFGSMALQNSNAVNITGGNVAVTTLSGAITIANGGTGLGTTPTNGQLLIGNGSGYTLSTLTAGSGVTITNGSGSITIAATNSGTVTSVGLDGGTTGITVSGANPITSSGTFTLGGVLNIANGGTGATTAAGARTAFGAAKSGANSDITSLSGLTTPLSPAQGGTGAAASLSGYVVANGSSAYTSVLTIPVSDLTGTLPVNQGGTGATTAAGARVNLLNSYSGNAGRVLAVNAGGTDTEWISVAGAGTVTSVDVSGGATGLTTSGGPITAAGTITLGGTLAPTAGGTGITSFAVGDLLFANTTTSLDKLTVGTNGYLLASNGTAPQYVNPTSVTVGAATTAVTATNLAGGAGGSIPYQSIAGTTTFLASGNGVLTASGGNPSYTMTPSLTQVTVAADPTLALQVATKQYVDTIATTSVHYHTPVKYEVPNTTGNLNATYNNGASGVGATLTNAGTLGAFTPDGIVASVNDRILIYNQTNAYENGVYTVTTVGNGSTPWVLTRATDANTYDPISPNALGGGDAFFVTSGNTGAGETYVCNNVGTITFGTTAITFVQVSATQVYSAGTGLTLTGTTFSLTAPVATSLGGTGLSSFTSGGAVYATSTSALTTGTLPVTAGGTGKTTLSAGYLLNGNGTSDVSASIIYDDGANVGIGCTGSLSKLTLPNGSIFSFQDSGGISRNVMQFLSTGELRYGGAGAGIVSDTFYTGGSERMRIDSSGNVGIGTNSPAARAHIVNSTLSAQLRLQDVTTDATNKYGFIGSGHYTNAEEPVCAIGVGSLSASNTVYIGGGGSSFNAATSIQFYTAANNTTVTGTEAMRIDSAGQVGIGATPSAGTTLRIGKALTGAASGLGVYNNQAIQSDVTSGAQLFSTFPTTAAAAFTLGSLTHYSASQSTIGAGSAITNQYGFLVQSSLTGATNNYGFYGNIASGTGRYNIYMAGTADNYLAGNLGIGTATPGTYGTLAVLVNTNQNFYAKNTSSVTEIGSKNTANTAWNDMAVSGYSLRFNTGTNTEAMRISDTGNVGIGTASPGQKLTIAAGRISLDEAYQVFWQGAGTNRARIYGDSGSNFIIETGAANTERFRISANGAIGLSGANYGSAGQVLTSNGSGSAPTWNNIDGGTF